MEKNKIIFIGTGAIGSDLLRALTKGFFDLPLVVTGPDKPAGRKLQLQPSPIKVVAEELGIEVFQPIDINAEMSISRLANFNPDFLVVMAYGQIVSQAILSIPKIACLNIHASLLPNYRGASPIQASLLNQDKKTGISLMQMEEKMDTGPVYGRFELNIGDQDTAVTLSDRLAKLSAEEIPKAIQEIAAGHKPTPQDHSKASYCSKISKADGEIDWTMAGTDILARIRAFDPWPGTYTFYDKKRLKILSAEVGEETHDAPGMLSKAGIASSDIMIKPLTVQPEGKTVQSFQEFLRAHAQLIGTTFK